jgi:serine/threonine-protein kinase
MSAEPSLPGTTTTPQEPDQRSVGQSTLSQETVQLEEATATRAATLPAAERYQPLEFHARGNLGEVHLAEDNELHRLVALKRIQERHADDAVSRQRFQREAEITSRLEHPGVVPVYGLGEDPQGRPCYAMRFIQGESFKDTIQHFHAADLPGRDPGERRIERRQLLTSFVAVCKTMAYAHSRGILHRDLKPANIMLGKYGETLVVDWGLAKAMDRPEGAQASEESLSEPVPGQGSETQIGAFLGTPAYSSPEQAAGHWDKVGPASDIYSLGAVLYQVLTNAMPYSGPGVAEIVAQSCQGALIPPRQRKKDVPRALEAICLKAMARKSEDRYGSAAALADDIEHWLADEPVTVYCERWLQRLGRWARRHRVLASSSVAGVTVAAASLALVALLMGQKNAELAAANNREHAAAELARQTIEDMTSEDALHFLQTQKELRPEQRHFLEQAVAYYQQALGEEASGEEGQARQAQAYFRMGKLQQRLGLNAEAEATLRDALEEYQRLAAEHPQVPEYYQELATTHNSLGILLSDLGKRPQAEEEYRAAMAEQERLAAEHPQVPAYRQELALSHNNLGNLLSDLGKRPEAEKEYRAALVEKERLAAEYPQVPAYRHELAINHNNLGRLLAALGRRLEAEKEYRAAVVEQERLAVEHPQVPEYHQELAKSQNNLGVLLASLGKRPEAEQEFRTALAGQERLAAKHPQVPEYRQELARSHNNLGLLLKELGKQSEAEKEFRAGLVEKERLAAEHPEVPAYAVDLAGSYGNFGFLLSDQGQPAEALDWYARAIATLEGARGKPGADVAGREVLRNAHGGRAEALTKLRRYTEAISDWNRALGLDDGSAEVEIRTGRAKTQLQAGDVARASAEADELLKTGSLNGDALYDIASFFCLASAKTKEPAQAERYAGRAVTALRQAVAKGYRNSEHLKKDSDFDLLRPRADFQKLLRELEVTTSLPGK